MFRISNDQHRSRIFRIVYCALFTLVFSFSALADQITLNLKDADIRALISTVSKFTGKNFIIDPRVKAKVTVVSTNTMSAEEVYEVFLSVLQVHGFAAVPTGTVIKIVPEVNAKQGPLPLVDNEAEQAGDEFVTKIVRLEHVPAAQLVPILRPLVPQQGHLAAYAPTNTLIITDHAGNIHRLMQIIRGVDRPESDELEIIQLKHASASELVRILTSLYQTAGKPETSKVTLAADDRTNSILITGEPSIRIKIRATIMHLDTPLEDGGNTHVIYLKYAKAENLVAILTGIQQSTTTTGSGSVANKNAAAIAAARSANTSSIAKDAVIQADEETNALVITADPNTLRSLKAVIRQLDIRRAQVLIEAIIAEITENRNKEIGVGMAVDGTAKTGSNNLPVGLSNLAGIGNILAGIATGSADTAASIGSGLTLAGGGTNSSGVRYALLIRALAADQNSNILSTPSIVTLDNEEAEIVVGQNVPFITGSFTNAGSTDPANPFQTIERQDVGLTLRVTPQVNEGDTIKLDLEQETSSVIPGSEVTGITTRKRSIKTSVLIDDGGILVLGGLIEESATDTITKVPLLGDIPLLGRLFQSQSTTKDKQNLMVFLRPSILRDQSAASRVTNEKYSYLRGLQQREQYDDGFGLLDEKPPVLPPIPVPATDKPADKPSDATDETPEARVEVDWRNDFRSNNDDFF